MTANMALRSPAVKLSLAADLTALPYHTCMRFKKNRFRVTCRCLTYLFYGLSPMLNNAYIILSQGDVQPRADASLDDLRGVLILHIISLSTHWTTRPRKIHLDSTKRSTRLDIDAQEQLHILERRSQTNISHKLSSKQDG